MTAESHESKKEILYCCC